MKAKDRATGKEQQVRITASSMLSKDDVEKMVREASDHADEDRKRREDVETRNQAEQLSYQAEKALKDLGDKVSSEDKADVEGKVSALREALKSADIEPVQKAATALAESLSKVSTKAYEASAAEASGGPAGDGASGGEPGPAPAGEETVEGEFKEV